MSRGKRLKKSVIDMIARESIGNPEVDRQVLADELRHRIELMCEIPPTRETLMKMISGFRNQKADYLDTPWTLAESVARGFPTESTPALLSVWRYCHALGKPFSIRQAKWAAYLSTLISNTVELVDWSDLYANFEKIYEMRELGFNSTDLDAALTMSAYENATAIMLGKVLPIPVSGGGILTRPATVTDSIENAYAATRIAEHRALHVLRINDIAGDGAADEDWDVLQPLKNRGLTEDLIWIYVHWLIAFSSSPKWRVISRNQAIDIMIRLRDWVAENLPKIKLDIAQSVVDAVKNGREITLRDFPMRDELIPRELGEMAGFKAANSG